MTDRDTEPHPPIAPGWPDPATATANPEVAEEESRRDPVYPARLLDAALGMVIGLVVSTLGAGILVAVTGEVDSLGNTAAGLIGLWVGLVGAAIWSSRRRGTKSLRRDFGLCLTIGDVGIGLLAAITTQIAIVFIYLPFAEVSEEAGQPAEDIAGQSTGTASMIVLFLLVAIGAPLVEELFFRGVLLGALKRRFGSLVAVAGSVGVFVLLHPFLSIPALALLGTTLALLVIWRRSLGAALVTHVVFNLVSLSAAFAATAWANMAPWS